MSAIGAAAILAESGTAWDQAIAAGTDHGEDTTTDSILGRDGAAIAA